MLYALTQPEREMLSNVTDTVLEPRNTARSDNECTIIP